MTHDLVSRHHDGPVDDRSAERMRSRGLELRRVDNADRPAFDGWLDAVSRGFLDDERNDVQREATAAALGQRRAVGVFDADVPEPLVPVGTFASWVAELTVPGGVLASAGISSVTVSPTHRRRGIARAMMESELRRSAAEGLAVASLTVSESTLYGRYGFGPAAPISTWSIDVKRAGWIGPTAHGRVDFVSRERAGEVLADLHARVRPTRPGEFEMPHGHVERFVRTRADSDKPRQIRAVQYTAADGVIRGLALYTVTENEADYTKSSLALSYLLAEDADAYAGLWRFFLEMDLIGTLTADELSTDEPLLWMIRDQRAATVTLRDHHYLRLLDVPAALQARRYGAPGVLAIEVDDPLEIADGRWILTVDADGSATVQEWTGDAAPEGAVTMRLAVADLASIYLGGVSPATLAAAGRVEVTDAAAAAAVFSWHVAPRLSYWY